ncbi:hypothetical protein [Streptomyces sp. NPDC050982]|uniref:hypothetical protein n=1 Tax=Streptomyces sp. NPDC050982 TaxID=3154746 RepID=UPI0033F5BF6F
MWAGQHPCTVIEAEAEAEHEMVVADLREQSADTPSEADHGPRAPARPPRPALSASWPSCRAAENA